MNEFDYKKIAEHSLKYFENAHLNKSREYIKSEEGNNDFNIAYEGELNALNESFESCIAILNELINISSGAEWLNYIGAGPLEDAFNLYGMELVNYLKKINDRKDTNWQIAINAVWKSKMSYEVWAELQKLKN